MMTERQATARWPRGDMSRVKPVPFLPGVRSPPLRGGTQGKTALRGKPEMRRKVVFSEGRGLRARMARQCASRGITRSSGANEHLVAKWGHAPARPIPSSRACGARPSAGLVIRARMALRGKPGDDAKGDFLGGTHSVRPRGKAVPMPRHNMIIGGKGTPGGLMGQSPGGREAFLAGVQSPPLHGGKLSRDDLAGKTLR